MKLIIVRHGETEANLKSIVQGHLHGKLTKKGRQQAKCVALRLKDEKIDLILSSDLKRAIDTAKEIKGYHKAPLKLTKELRERNTGIYNGKHIEIVKAAREKSGKSMSEFKPKNGESYIEVKKRVHKFLKKILAKHKGNTIVIVTHSAFIRMLLSIILEKSMEEAFELERQGNASVSIITFEGRERKVHIINCTKHLDGTIASNKSK
ncbi:MAG: histidine phosphatase family protein [Nanoarchaeota archaeon]|nr:histidine phosphatase family protein [Nanoarchaeota archaeon]